MLSSKRVIPFFSLSLFVISLAILVFSEYYKVKSNAYMVVMLLGISAITFTDLLIRLELKLLLKLNMPVILIGPISIISVFLSTRIAYFCETGKWFDGSAFYFWVSIILVFARFTISYAIQSIERIMTDMLLDKHTEGQYISFNEEDDDDWLSLSNLEVEMVHYGDPDINFSEFRFR